VRWSLSPSPPRRKITVKSRLESERPVRSRYAGSLPPYFKSPEQLLLELGVSEPSDILIEAIAQHCGATILYESLEGSEARLLGYGARALITVNKNAGVPRQRFSAAHELGHWMWDRGKMAFSCAEQQFHGEWSKDNPERRANRYAEELLLPRSLFLREARSLPLSLASVKSLAHRFQTSLSATAIRLVELSDSLALLVCSEQGRRRWFVRSGSVPWGYRVKNLVVPGSRIEEAPGSFWLEPREGTTVRLPETILVDPFRIAPNLVLTLLTWVQPPVLN